MVMYPLGKRWSSFNRMHWFDSSILRWLTLRASTLAWQGRICPLYLRGRVYGVCSVMANMTDCGSVDLGSTPN